MGQLTVDEYISRLMSFENPAVMQCGDPDGYVEKVMEPWFNEIAPARAYQYGVQGMNRFGVRGSFAQIINCYHRWLRFKELDFQVDWMDTMRDLFGYGIITAIVNGETWQDIRWNVVYNRDSVFTGERIFEKMVERIWDREVTFQAGTYALALPYRLWTEYWKEANEVRQSPSS